MFIFRAMTIFVTRWMCGWMVKGWVWPRRWKVQFLPMKLIFITVVALDTCVICDHGCLPSHDVMILS